LDKKLRDFIHLKRKEIESLLKETFLIVFLMGAGNKGLEERRRIKRKLEENGILAIIAEDDLPKDLSPSLSEEYILKNSEVELAFINVESWGSVAEFSQYHRDQRIALKLRVLVRGKYHPLYGDEKGYLTDLYLTHLAVYWHVYAYEGKFPSCENIIMKLATRYRQWKTFR